MKTSLLFVLSCICCIASGQAPSPKKVLGSFIFKGTAYNYEFMSTDSENHSLKVSTSAQSNVQQPVETDTTETEASVNPTTSASVDYIFSEFDQEVFQTIFKNQMISKHRVANDAKLHDKSIEIFFKVKSKFEFLDDEPVTAYLIMKRDFVHSLLKGNTSVYYTGALSKMVVGHRVVDVSVETEDGAIKNIVAQFVAPTTKVGDASPRRYVEFKNTFPISISGKFDPDYFANIKLYCLNCYGVKGLDRFIKLSDLLMLDVVLQNDKEDYSPVNSVINLSPTHTVAELRKEKRSRIVDVAVFTDFAGLDQEQPNGLIQFEAKRKINIITKSRQISSFETIDEISNQLNLSGIHEVGRAYGTKKLSKKPNRNRIQYTLQKVKLKTDLPVTSKHIKTKDTVITRTYRDSSAFRTDTKTYVQYITTLKNKRFRSPYWVWGNYIEPKLLFSKIDQNNRFIDSLSLSGNRIDPVTLIKYQLVSFGATLNVLKISFPQWKLSLNALSVGGYWFRSRVGFSSDSSRASVPINSSYLLLSSEIVFKPDNRWGATFGMNYIKPSIWSTAYELTKGSPVMQPYFDAFLKTNDTDKLFFRFRWSYEHKGRENNFTQIQLGYNLSLFSGTGSTKAAASN